jgi:hypothetical protein
MSRIETLPRVLWKLRGGTCRGICASHDAKQQEIAGHVWHAGPGRRGREPSLPTARRAGRRGQQLFELRHPEGKELPPFTPGRTSASRCPAAPSAATLRYDTRQTSSARGSARRASLARLPLRASRIPRCPCSLPFAWHDTSHWTRDEKSELAEAERMARKLVPAPEPESGSMRGEQSTTWRPAMSRNPYSGASANRWASGACRSRHQATAL